MIAFAIKAVIVFSAITGFLFIIRWMLRGVKASLVVYVLHEVPKTPAEIEQAASWKQKQWEKIKNPPGIKG